MTYYTNFASIFDEDKTNFFDFRSKLLTYAAGCSTARDFQEGMLYILLTHNHFHQQHFQYHGDAIPGTPEVPWTPEILSLPARPAVDAIAAAMGVAAVPASLAVPAISYVATTPTVPAIPDQPVGPVTFHALLSSDLVNGLAANATALQLTMYPHALNQFKYYHDNHPRQREQFVEFTQTLRSALSETVQNRVAGWNP